MNKAIKISVYIWLLQLAASILLAYSSSAHADDTEFNLQAVDKHIIPAYRSLASATQRLDTSAQAFCRQVDEKNLQQLREAFHTSMDAWQSIQHIRFGPVEFLLRLNRYQLWPDKRNSVAKHLRKLLVGQDNSALEAVRFAKGSVAVQGFSALERLLFSEDVTPTRFSLDSGEGRYRCAVVTAITSNLQTMSSRISLEWSEGDNAYRTFIASAPQGNDFFENELDASSRFLNNLHTQLQAIVENKLDRPLGSSLQKARGKLAESWRSERSLRNIRLNLTGLREFYRTAFAGRVAQKTLDKDIENGFERSLAALDRIKMPLHVAVDTEDVRPEVESLRSTINSLRELVAGPLPQNLDIPLGFNSMDGD